jgi:Peptidase family S41/N-terminal domain of Peptidase_S41 in eukaryotic IRBP
MEQPPTGAIIEHVARLLTERYIFPDVGASLAHLLVARETAGRYAGATDPEALATLVTEDLQSVNGDRHLRLLHSEEELPDEANQDAELAELARHAAGTMGGVARLRHLDGNVAHLALDPMLYPPSIAGPAMVAAMNLVATAGALLLDLRRCRGGDPDMVALVCTFLYGPEPVHLMDLVARDTGIRQFWTQAYVPGPRFGPAKPLFVLTSATTFSGAEEVSYDLQQTGRATVVGERTGGGAHPCERFRVHPHLRATIPVAQSVSPVTGGNWEGSGITPDVVVPASEALETAHRLALAALARRPDEPEPAAPRS